MNNILEVCHTKDLYESFVTDWIKKRNITLDQFFMRYNDIHYQDRNNFIVNIIKKLKHDSIFEFACSMEFLAKTLVTTIDGIQKYKCTNFSPMVVNRVKSELINFKNCSTDIVDANVTRCDDLKNQKLEDYDIILTTSFEHIEFDKELIQIIPKGKSFVFVVPSLDKCPEHFRMFNSEKDVIDRYKDLLNFVEIVPFTCDPIRHKKRTWTFFICSSIVK